MSEHLPGDWLWTERAESPARKLDYTALGKQLNDLVVQPVVNEVGIAMDEIDDLVLVDQLPNCGRILTIHEFPRLSFVQTVRHLLGSFRFDLT